MHWYLKVVRNYVGFSGRAQRAEYWWFFLFNTLFAIAFAFVDMGMGNLDPETGYGPLSSLYTLVVMLPGLAVTVRRLHDTGRSGWWFLIVLIPLIGVFVLLYFLVSDSEPAPNVHGLNPKEPGSVGAGGTG